MSYMENFEAPPQGERRWGACGDRVSMEVRVQPDGSTQFATFETMSANPIPVLSLTPAAVVDLIGFLLGNPPGSTH